ncbi:OprD family porin [Pseudomonas sp. BN417]|uniref:OprD family porin n=1 Tax=Pseudomonas sp. BN417 TaxID=2567890 RepID=UPI002458F0D9|nr:OprD family porin [Pseudomonas sp. BN417]MDH4554513.1 OprD family porin [Pseudomonas sp. BN417]
MRLATTGLACAALFAGDHGLAMETKGFIEDSRLDLVNRNYYFNRDFRNGASNGQGVNAALPPGERNGYREEWAHGLMARYSSGYTEGTLGFGLDAQALLGLKLDSGGGRTGTGLLPIQDNRQPQATPADDYARLGGALKARLSASELKWGDMQVSAPVFTTADSRLLPETATGLHLASREIPGLLLEAGHFTAYTQLASSNHDDSLLTRYSDAKVRSLDYLGGSYRFSDTLSAKLYHARAEDHWLQNYLNLNHNLPLGRNQGLNLDFHLYRSDATGRELSGAVDNTSWSLAAAYRLGAHRFTLAHQQIEGDTPFDYVGGLSIDLANSVQLSDFNAPGMKSRQARYDLDLAGYGIPGLSLMTRYVTGQGASDDGWTPGRRFAGGPLSTYGSYDGARWHELDIDLRYVIQQGWARGMLLRTRFATYRGNREAAAADLPDINEVRLIAEHPLNIL